MIIHSNLPNPESSSRFIETKEYKLFREPRISANKLGEYLVADESRKITILKNSKKAPKAITIHYTKARSAFPKSFRPDGFSSASLSKKATQLQNLIVPPGWEADENRLSSIVLEQLALVVDQIVISDASQLPRPKEGWGGLTIANVRISVNPDCVFTMPYRGQTRVGAVMLYTTKDDTKSLSRNLGDYAAGDYVAAILLRILEQNVSNSGKALPSKCFVVDVHRKQIYQPSTRAKTLFNHIDAACQGIASRWDDIRI